MMRKLMISMALLGTVMAVTPAAAQYRANDRYGYDQNQGQHYSRDRLQNISMRIDRNIQRGTISNREGYALKRELGQIYRLDQRYRYDGLNRWEYNDLERRTAALAQRLRYERQEGQNGWSNDNRDYNDRSYDNRRNYDRRYERDDD